MNICISLLLLSGLGVRGWRLLGGKGNIGVCEGELCWGRVVGGGIDSGSGSGAGFWVWVLDLDLGVEWWIWWWIWCLDLDIEVCCWVFLLGLYVWDWY